MSRTAWQVRYHGSDGWPPRKRVSDSEGRLKVGLLRHLHSVTSPYQVGNFVGWCGLQGFVGKEGSA